MYTFYLICLLAGGTLMALQFLLSFMGIGDHHDTGGDHDFHGHDVHHAGHHAGHDHQGSWFVGVLTFRALVAALTFFGIAGMTAHSQQLEAGPTLVVALAAGAAALFLVAYMMRALSNLKAEGTARIERAVGHNGTVYLPIPAEKGGVGKVQLNLQNRTVEYQAITPHQQLPTRARVVVTAVVSPDTVEVVPVSASGSANHA